MPINFQIIKDHPVEIGEIKVYLVWFDSYGAKSSCIFIETSDLKLLVDPGAACMQPGYPLSDADKEELYKTAMDTILNFSLHADTVFISHYHYDHHFLPSVAKKLYAGKKIWIKDPNLWINHSQWKRGRLFFNQLYEASGGKNFKSIYTQPPASLKLEDPVKQMPLAMAKDYGDYQKRKNQLLEKGRAWFEKMAHIWQNNDWMPEFKINDMEVQICDGRCLKKGSTTVRFTNPMFHGIEYDRVGWVVGLIVEHGDKKVLYASDLQGPTIEDYARWIINENPDILILDGPATYLFGYMINRINLQRSINNVCDILKTTATKTIIYDHHLLREIRYKDRMAQAYTTADKYNKTFLTAAEWMGDEPLILKIAKNKNE